MKLRVLPVFFLLVLSTIVVFSQENENSEKRARLAQILQPTPTPNSGSLLTITDNLPKPAPTPASSPTPQPTPVIVVIDEDQEKKAEQNNNLNNSSRLSYGQIQSKINEAKRQMSARPIPTAFSDDFLKTDIIRVAFHDNETNKMDYIVMTKASFLTRDAEFVTTSSNSKPVRVRIVRPNWTNTPIMISSLNNVFHLPVLVQYPIEKYGKFVEMAYYVSTHPGLVTPEVVNAGKFYIRNTLDIARVELRKKGIFIAPQVIDMAERLAIVEHIDHQRFWNEFQPNLFNEVYALYALNQGQTYRYSVSSAGAGGMVQMIPSTYRIIQRLYPQAVLIPDFVDGMRTHSNAAQAMLIYMQMTWNDLVSNDTVYKAIQDGIATPAQLMAAGYNSNPARLSGYIRRGGANWVNLIPRETKIYLEINESMDKYFPLEPRTK